MSFLSINKLCAAYGRTQVLNSVSFTAEQGEITGILGSNGCGKTTLLKSVCGILPHTGSSTLNGETLDGLSARKIARLCSYVPQRSGIAIDLSALDVVLMGFNPQLGLLQQPDGRMRAAAKAALETVGLGTRTNDNYLTLSEGQKQLCILARALVAESNLLLLDEPESALDFDHRRRMLHLIRQWVQTGKRCAVIALHDPQLALNHCDRLILLKGGKTDAVLLTKQDELPFMEDRLRRIYGGIQLLRCADRQGKQHLVMIHEQEENA